MNELLTYLLEQYGLQVAGTEIVGEVEDSEGDEDSPK